MTARDWYRLAYWWHRMYHQQRVSTQQWLRIRDICEKHDKRRFWAAALDSLITRIADELEMEIRTARAMLVDEDVDNIRRQIGLLSYRDLYIGVWIKEDER